MNWIFSDIKQKMETYSKAEIDELFSQYSGGTFEIDSTQHSTGTSLTIANYDGNKDNVMIFKNGFYLADPEEYEINADGTVNFKITNNSNSVWDVVVLKGVKDYTPEGGGESSGIPTPQVSVASYSLDGVTVRMAVLDNYQDFENLTGCTGRMTYLASNKTEWESYDTAAFLTSEKDDTFLKGCFSSAPFPVEDYNFTFDTNGKPYQIYSLYMCIGNPGVAITYKYTVIKDGVEKESNEVTIQSSGL